MTEQDSHRTAPVTSVSHGLNHYEPSDAEIRYALRFAPERQPESAEKRKRRTLLVGGAISLSGAALAYWGYRLGGVPMAIGMLGAATVGTLFRLLPSLLAAQARRSDREEARQIAIQNRYRIDAFTKQQNDDASAGPDVNGMMNSKHE